MRRRICLTLPTNRACTAMVSALSQEAAHAAEHFDVDVHVLILDSSGREAFAEHARTVRDTRQAPDVTVHHLDEAEQRGFLREIIRRSEQAQAERVLALMLPEGVSYGSCTNRAFLIARALGCESVHRRDSDSRYQLRNGRPVFPVHQELLSLGKRTSDAARHVSRTALEPCHEDRRVVLVGGSFIGEMSVDLGEMHRLHQGLYHDIVALWAPLTWPEEKKRELVDESFKGAGTEAFTHDRSVLGRVDPMRVDMCNISFFQVHERVPLLPATDTIGSDYFLIHLVHAAGLPGVLHNRNIVNFHTGERRTDSGFTSYQLAFVKFLLSMLYLNWIYTRMGAAGTTLLDQDGAVRASLVAELVRESTALDVSENVARLDVLERSFQRLGGRYASIADRLTGLRPRLLEEARRDMEDFALLIDSWNGLMRAASTAGFHQLSR
ncbi:DUF6271 family protein [Nonomuraea sp. NPDC001699]